MSWLAHIIGLDNVSGPWYAFWSGFGGDIEQFALVAAFYGIVRRHNCHVHGCWRIGRHRIEGTDWVVCRHHHPTGAPSAEDLKGIRP